MGRAGDHLRRMHGFGRFPVVEGRIAEARGVDDVVRASRDDGGALLAQGNRRSYGDACLGPRVLSMRPMRRVLAFDPETGRIRVEAGITIGELIDRVLPHDWFPPVVPGTRHATVGGCLAADVHGKNHHVDGSFGEHVEAFDIVLARDGSSLRCDRSENAELFRATLGGMGLTGIVTAVDLTLRRVESAWIRRTTIRCDDLDACFDRLEDEGARARYSVAWIDALGTTSRAHGISDGRGVRTRTVRGRGVVQLGDHAPASALAAGVDPRSVPHRPVRRVPAAVPSRLLSRPLMRAFNAAWFRRGRSREDFAPYDSFFFPLDVLDGWNRLYGRAGFIQYQFVVPAEHGRAVTREILERFVRDTPGPFLAVLKTLRDGSGGPLSFPRAGSTLALDVPRRGRSLADVVRACDRCVREAGGRIYLAKDALLAADDFEAMYPQVGAFRTFKRTVDPDGRLRSALSDRLGITRRS